MSGIGELLAARTSGNEPRLIVSFEVIPRSGAYEGDIMAVCVLPTGGLVVEPVTDLSVDWHYDGENWKPDFETP